MAKKKIQPRRVPRTAEPRMYGDGKPSAQTQTAERPNGAAKAATATAAAATAVAATTPRPGTTARASGAAVRTALNPARPPVTMTQDYSYVLKDLRRLGILAAGTFALLVVLGLFIR